MKHLLVILMLTALIATQDAAPTAEGENASDSRSAGNEATPKPPCPLVCTLESNPVCGYEGNCYRQYANQCAYDTDKCTKRTSLETVDPSLCELAEKDTHPNYKICPND